MRAKIGLFIGANSRASTHAFGDPDRGELYFSDESSLPQARAEACAALESLEYLLAP